MLGKLLFGLCVLAAILWAAGVDVRKVKSSILSASSHEAGALTGSDRQGDWGR